MSDKLFKYFLVYDTADRPVELEDVDGRELLGQVVEEVLSDLENRGFHVEREGIPPPCRLCINVDLFRRLFGNLFSNIEKYADKDSSVTVRYELRDGCLGVCLCSGVPDSAPQAESTEIGLKTYEKIMADLGGRFHTDRTEDRFSAHIWLPVQAAGA